MESRYSPITAPLKTPIEISAMLVLQFPCQGKCHMGQNFKYENKVIKIAKEGKTAIKPKNHKEKQQ